MKIFIPKNLTNIEIISQLKKMIDGYVDYYEKSNESFDNYYYQLKNDDQQSFYDQHILQHQLSQKLCLDF